jgi:hypothetical protein
MADHFSRLDVSDPSQDFSHLTLFNVDIHRDRLGSQERRWAL